MVFDYKKEYKEYYAPSKKPAIVNIPKMNYIAIDGKGNPNDEKGEYQEALELLYAVAYTIKMSYKGNYKIEGFFEYVVPPLEGLWWQAETSQFDYTKKENFCWTSLIRLPDFVTEKDFEWAIEQASKKKKLDFSKVRFLKYEEGCCVQCMHIGSYDDEPKTIEAIDNFALENGYEIDISKERLHHEIYLSDPRKCEASKLKTIIRHPIKKRV